MYWKKINHVPSAIKALHFGSDATQDVVARLFNILPNTTTRVAQWCPSLLVSSRSARLVHAANNMHNSKAGTALDAMWAATHNIVTESDTPAHYVPTAVCNPCFLAGFCVCTGAGKMVMAVFKSSGKHWHARTLSSQQNGHPWSTDMLSCSCRAQKHR